MKEKLKAIEQNGCECVRFQSVEIVEKLIITMETGFQCGIELSATAVRKHEN